MWGGLPLTKFVLGGSALALGPVRPLPLRWAALPLRVGWRFIRLLGTRWAPAATFWLGCGWALALTGLWLQ